MCDYCSKVNLVKNILTPREYEKIVKYIKELIEKDGFIFVEGNCVIGKHMEDGHWIDDIVYHTIKCPKCGQVFTCIINSYRGGGSFEKGR